jgi:ParB family chromosome partitioning protein
VKIEDRILETITIPIDAIEVRSRQRSELGDIQSLADNIDSTGLIHPITVTKDYVLVAGGRRMAAMKLLGREEIRCQILGHDFDDAEVAIIEWRENKDTKNFTPSEAVAAAALIEAAEKEKALDRKRAGGKGGLETCGHLTTSSESGASRDKVAKAVGMSESTLRRAKIAVQTGIPEVAEAMDAGTISIASAAKIAKLPTEDQKSELEIIKDGARKERPKDEPQKPRKRGNPKVFAESGSYTVESLATEAIGRIRKMEGTLLLKPEVSIEWIDKVIRQCEQMKAKAVEKLNAKQKVKRNEKPRN